MASLDDILTTQKNGVVAINGLRNVLQIISDNVATSAFPEKTSPTVLASTTQLITAGTGRIYGVSIPVHAGAGQIFIYDSATVGGIAAANCIYSSVPSNGSGGGQFLSYELVTITYSKGIVLKTDAGMNCCVTYTPVT